MKRLAVVAALAGSALFISLLVWQGIGSVGAALTSAGWGLLLIVMVHALPLVLDSAAIGVLVRRSAQARPWRAALMARWLGESVNSLMPAGQLGGPVLMARYLGRRGLPGAEAAAVVTVSTTLQAVAQLVFTLVGIALCCAYASKQLVWPLLLLSAMLAGLLWLFYVAQRRSVFSRSVRCLSKLSQKRDWSWLLLRAQAIDEAVQRMYRERGSRAVASFGMSLLGWVIGTAEVWLALRLIGHPIGWSEALLLESLGQAVRGAAFAVPGALGVQEGGYLLLATLVGLPADAALALSLLKRAREVMLGLPGLLYLFYSERRSERARRSVNAAVGAAAAVAVPVAALAPLATD